MSANESNCKPKGDDTFNIRAAKPSPKSAIAAAMTKYGTAYNLPFRAQIIATQPNNKLSKVSKLGIWCFIQKGQLNYGQAYYLAAQPIAAAKIPNLTLKQRLNPILLDNCPILAYIMLRLAPKTTELRLKN